MHMHMPSRPAAVAYAGACVHDSWPRHIYSPACCCCAPPNAGRPQGLEFESLVKAVSNERLPFTLRSIMLQVLAALYVDVDPFTVSGRPARPYS